jgi:hypothetical protein
MSFRACFNHDSPGEERRKTMSENQEMEKGLNPMNILPNGGGMQAERSSPTLDNVNNIDESIDGQSYFLGEVPQSHLVDPCAFLPLNSDRLIGSVNMTEKLLFEVGVLIEEEVGAIQKHQKRITFWEDRIEKNKAHIKKNEIQIKQNWSDSLYDKKNRDYWFGRAEDVESDYARAEVSTRQQDWSWLIKKYGLKNADGTEISSKANCVEELCNGEIKNLAAEYRGTGNKYEHSRKEKEAENSRLVRENAKLLNNNDVLQNYIAATYANDIEPIQDGVLLLKEFGVKLKALGQDDKTTFGEMRSWAEQFLSDFLKANSRVSQSVVTHFRKLASIPLPPEYC